MNRVNLADIHLKFDKSVNWNALLFVVNKTSITLVSFMLFRKLTPEHYSLWANIYSVVFAVLLWADLGFRKSIPQFLPIFSKSRAAHKSFISLITKVQIASLAVGAVAICYFVCCRNIPWGLPIVLGLIMFFVEGPLALLRLFYHSHFLNKEFNLVCSSALLMEISANLFLVFTVKSSYQLLISVMCVKIASSLIVDIIGLYQLRNIYGNFSYQDEPVQFKESCRQFAKHSLAMWGTTNLKSLSERNVLVPVLTAAVGMEFANMFKVANDGAIWVQRVVLKLIGSSDTALFAHAERSCKESLQKNFKKLTAKIWALALPLFGLLGLLFLFQSYFGGYNVVIFRSFIYLATFYLIENLLSPYERVLEAHFDYRPLAIANALYVAALLLLALKLQGLSLPLFAFLLGVVRLVSLLVQYWYARRRYGV